MSASINYRELVGGVSESDASGERGLVALELHDSIVRNDVKQCRKLLETGVNVNTFSRFSYNSGSLERRLVSHDCKALPLHLACIYRRPQALALLLKYGADPNLPDHMGRTPLQLVVMYWPRIPMTPHWRSLPSDERQYQEYLEKQHRKARQAMDLLLAGGATVEVTIPGHGQNLLHLAARYNIHDCVEVLVKAGAVVDGRDTEQRTPAIVAAESQNYDTLRQLVQNGADVNLADFSGTSPAHFLALLDRADQSPHLKYLILEHGACHSQRDVNGNTPLHIASQVGNENSIHTLIQYGANPDFVNTDGQIPLFLLLDNPSNCNCDYGLLFLLQNTIQVRMVDKCLDTPTLLKAPQFAKLRQELLAFSCQPATLQWASRLVIRRAIGLWQLNESTVRKLPCPPGLRSVILFNTPMSTMPH